MDIQSLNKGGNLPLRLDSDQRDGEVRNGPDFLGMVKSFLRDTNALQYEAGKKVDAFIAGESVDIQDVMIARQKASVSFDFVMELRNKILEAYQDLMRTQA